MAKKKTASKKTPSFEKLVATVEQELGKLESGELSLEDSLSAYESGVRALKQCHGILKQAEGKIELLVKGEGETSLAEYDVETGAAKQAEPAPELDDEDDDDHEASEDELEENEPGSLPF